MRTALNRLITTNVLKQMDDNGWALDSLLENNPEFAEKAALKNVCAKISPQLADELDNVCNFLGISKRSFIEAAFVEALNQAREIIRSEGLHEYHQERSTASKEAS